MCLKHVYFRYHQCFPFKMATPQANDGFTCSICLNSFQIPKALPCLHTFCQDCLQCYINKTFNQYDKSFLCPLCRTVYRHNQLFQSRTTILVKEIARHLPTNFYIEAKAKINNCNDKPVHNPLDKTKSYLYKIESFEKQIYDCKKQTEQQYHLSMIWGHTLKQGIKFCPQDNSADSLERQVKITLKKKCNNYQKYHYRLDKLLLDLKDIKEEIIRHLNHNNTLDILNQQPKTKSKKKTQASGNELNLNNIEQKFTEFKSNMEKSLVKITISESINELKILMDKMQLLWVNPDQEGTAKPSLFLRIASQDSNGYVFPKVNEFLYICSLKVMNDDTVVVCGTSPNLLLCYDADAGFEKSRFELCDEPRSMSIFNDTDVMVTFLNEARIDIINVFSHPPTIVKTIKTEKMYLQALCLDAEKKKILALWLKKRTYAYDTLQISTESDIAVLSTGRIQGLSSGRRLAYIKQRNLVLYPDKNRKCLLGFCLSSEKVVFKYYGDIEHPLVWISDICCSESFIFIADRRHHKVHKLGFGGRRLDIIKCHDFNIMWPLHIHVNRNRTMVICHQRKDTSYEIKTFLS